MAVPSSGELELRGDIALEVYGNATGTNISLGTMSDIAGFASPDAMTDFYGWQNATAPSATTNGITAVAETSFTANGNITSDGGASITERGFYVGTNSASPTNNTKYTVSGTTGVYSRSITGLGSSTTYYCWAYATNSAGTSYGGRVQATTVAAFVPTYAAAYQAQGNFNTQQSGAYYMIHSVNLYYLNPNTGGLVNYASNNQQGNYSYLSSYLPITSPQFSTNAKNYFYWLANPFSSTGQSEIDTSIIYATGGRQLQNRTKQLVNNQSPTWVNTPLQLVADSTNRFWWKRTAMVNSYYNSYLIYTWDYV